MNKFENELERVSWQIVRCNNREDVKDILRKMLRDTLLNQDDISELVSLPLNIAHSAIATQCAIHFGLQPCDRSSNISALLYACLNSIGVRNFHIARVCKKNPSTVRESLIKNKFPPELIDAILSRAVKEISLK